MLKKLSLRNVRLFKSLDISFNKNITVFIGNNATGKTTILESIYLLGVTKSHKTNNEEEIINNESTYSKIIGIEKKNYQLVFNKNQKKSFIDNKEQKKLSEFIGNLKVVMFSPIDLNLINGSPLIRRRFLDIEISKLNKEYLLSLSNYKKILKERQELLKKISPNDDLIFLNIISKKLIIEAKKIINIRDKFIQEINKNLISISDDKLEIIYNPSVKLSNIDELFEKKKEYDILTKNTNYGPHRDDIKFMINGSDVAFSSQGQIRSLVLSIKLSIANYIKKITNDSPIILLDDVLSELDINRQNRLFEIVGDYQVFITSTGVENIKKEILDKAQIFYLNNKSIKEYDINGKSL